MKLSINITIIKTLSEFVLLSLQFISCIASFVEFSKKPTNNNATSLHDPTFCTMCRSCSSHTHTHIHVNLSISQLNCFFVFLLIFHIYNERNKGGSRPWAMAIHILHPPFILLLTLSSFLLLYFFIHIISFSSSHFLVLLFRKERPSLVCNC